MGARAGATGLAENKRLSELIFGTLVSEGLQFSFCVLDWAVISVGNSEKIT
jgi:hypothetical protein